MSAPSDTASRRSSSTAVDEEMQATSLHQVESKADIKANEDGVESATIDPIAQRRASRRRIYTFIGLQLTLFLCALDG
jgi:hypothetical protein